MEFCTVRHRAVELWGGATGGAQGGTVVGKVVVTGLGAVSPLAHTWPETWRGLVEGRSGAGPITLFDAEELPVDIAAEVKEWDGGGLSVREARHLDRSVQFALVAAREAVDMAGLDLPVADPDRFGVEVASATGGLSTIHEQIEILQRSGYRRLSPHFLPNMLVDSAAAHLAMHFQARGPNMAVVTACATGSSTIGEAMKLIRRGEIDVALAGGTEAAVTPLFMAGFCQMRGLAQSNGEEPAQVCKPFDRRRRGLVVGEGAAILVLESEEHARGRGARPLAEVRGYALTCDAHHMAHPHPEAEGMAAAMRHALESADVLPDQVDYISAHGTGTILNDRLETVAIKKIFGDRAASVPVSSVKAATGHLMGASGTLEAALCIQTLQEGCVPPTLNLEEPDPECDLDYVPLEARPVHARVALSNSFGMGGHNASLVFRGAES